MSEQDSTRTTRTELVKAIFIGFGAMFWREKRALLVALVGTIVTSVALGIVASASFHPVVQGILVGVVVIAGGVTTAGLVVYEINEQMRGEMYDK